MPQDREEIFTAYQAWSRNELIKIEIQHLPGVSLRKKILYTKLAGIELENEPDVESEDVACAIEIITDIDGLLGPTPIDLEILKGSPRVYVKVLWTILNEMEMAKIQAIDNEMVDKCDMA
ncbi:hypothetical protein [Parasitella parasitica]|uniref:Uncharacterized protein n=1 Tax=Parasitella parasitica TaxID=35722 RepID=A0A0B7NUM1_9FUNG|nr:hypothetical protein [Parasitella parasitica]